MDGWLFCPPASIIPAAAQAPKDANQFQQAIFLRGCCWRAHLIYASVTPRVQEIMYWFLTTWVNGLESRPRHTMDEVSIIFASTNLKKWKLGRKTHTIIKIKFLLKITCCIGLLKFRGVLTIFIRVLSIFLKHIKHGTFSIKNDIFPLEFLIPIVSNSLEILSQ